MKTPPPAGRTPRRSSGPRSRPDTGGRRPDRAGRIRFFSRGSTSGWANSASTTGFFAIANPDGKPALGKGYPHDRARHSRFVLRLESAESAACTHGGLRRRKKKRDRRRYPAAPGCRSESEERQPDHLPIHGEVVGRRANQQDAAGEVDGARMDREATRQLCV
jgi:hypothetical protein